MHPKPFELARLEPLVTSADRRAFALVDLVASQLAWWWCVLWTRADHPVAAVIGPALYVGAHVTLASARTATLLLAASGVLVGLVGDGTLLRAGLMVFPSGATGGVAAPFMLALWAMFAVSLGASLAFLGRAPRVWRALFGALAGPLAYAGGERLGVLALTKGAAVAVAIEWVLAVTVLVRVAHGLQRSERAS
jgi:hypothetical protein